MKADKKFTRSIVIIVLLATICFASGIWVAGRPAGEPKITSDLISNKIEEINELAVTEYYYTKVGKFENRLDFYGWEVPLTLKRFIVSFDGNIKAGVDLSKAEVKVDGSRSISIKLPKAEILSHQIDLDSITVFDETKNIFNPIQITDYVDFSKDQQSSAEEEAIGKGLLAEASDRASEVIKQWLISIYGKEEIGGPKISVIVE